NVNYAAVTSCFVQRSLVAYCHLRPTSVQWSVSTVGALPLLLSLLLRRYHHEPSATSDACGIASTLSHVRKVPQRPLGWSSAFPGFGGQPWLLDHRVTGGNGKARGGVPY